MMDTEKRQVMLFFKAQNKYIIINFTLKKYMLYKTNLINYINISYNNFNIIVKYLKECDFEEVPPLPL